MFRVALDQSSAHALHIVCCSARSVGRRPSVGRIIGSRPLSHHRLPPHERIRILEVSSPDVDPHRRKQFVTVLDDRLPGGWKREPYQPDGANGEAPVPHQGHTFWYHNGLKHFLPAQYPHSVAQGYASYAAYSFGASVAGSAAMVLSTQTLLLAVGVVGSGPGQASVLAGALNWVLKDGVGQLGGVLYASFLGRTRRFDANPKRWRMVAALCLDLGTLLEILSPYATQTSASLVLPLACVANVLKNMGFLTASASRASLHQAMALKANLGDVTAKAGSQATAAGLGGTSLGIGISTFLSSSASVETYVVAFCLLSMIHQVGNYLSVRSVPLSHFNNQRLHILLEDYCRQLDVHDNDRQVVNPKALTPQQVAAQESILPWVSDSQSGASQSWLVIGARLSALAPNGGTELRQLFQTLSRQEYLVNKQDNGCILVTFSSKARGQDVLQGMLHAYMLNHHFGKSMAGADAVAKSLVLVEHHMPRFVDNLEKKGWKLGSESFIIEPPEATRYSVEG